jgi:hypothetical protein
VERQLLSLPRRFAPLETPAASRPHLKLVRSPSDGQLPVATDANSERRAHRRLTVSELSWLNHARIKYGPDVTLIDLSVGGAQIETTGFALQPGSAVVIELAAGKRTWPVPARVLRCQIAGLTPHPTYRGALAFKRPFKFHEIADVVESATEVNPVHEYARLNLALNRVGESCGSAATLTANGRQALEAAFTMVESARRRASTGPFINEMGRLLRILTASVENAADPAALVPEIVSRLHRTVPSLAVRVVDASHASQIRSDAVYFRVPGEGTATSDCLVIEFPRDCQLEAWHLQLLEAGAQLIGVSRNLASSRERSTVIEVAPERSEQRPERSDVRGWNKLVVRYLDGRLLKGYGRDFQPGKGSLDLWNEPDTNPESRMTIPFAHLKAVFFVHDFLGNPAHTAAADAEDPSARGRRITITFVDGEVLRGTTLGYSQNAVGFFVFPLDTTTNNTKMFVLAGAIRHMQFDDSSNRTSVLQPAASGAR